MSHPVLAPRWSSSTRFVVVTIAALFSLSNLWRLPYLLSEHGGGAFLLVYVLALVTMGLPLLSGQLLMARGTGTDVPGVLSHWTRDSAHSRLWVWCGYLAVAGAGLLLAAYSVVAAWALAYCMRAVTGVLDGSSLDTAQAQFVAFARDSERGFGWLLLFFCLLCATASRGLRRGVEPVMRTLALCMIAGLMLLGVSAVFDPHAGSAARAMFAVDFTALGTQGVLEALYQAFFSLSLGSGVIVAFGAYLPDDARVVRLSLIVILADVLAALTSAFVLGVFVSGSGMHLGEGVQSVFEILPVALDGSWRAPIVFVLVALVCVSTAIGLFEPVVRTVERRSGFSRLRSSLYAGLGLTLVGLLGLMSFGALGDWRLLGYDPFGWLLLAATHVIGPICGLLLCVLLGRVLARRRLVEAWHADDRPRRAVGFAVWHGLLRYPCRIALVVMLAYALGVFTLAKRIWGL
ncbi:sodium-dependent transporter [Salinisphaera sp. T31B1]|uniref:sodium-dependent transporter n=1 Tax=Salinisphaera sp. T31B1 TaxID=727963 RepID=UPI00333EFDD2